MDQVTKFVKPGKQFAKDSIRLVKKCTKPDRRGNANNFIVLSGSCFSLSLELLFNLKSIFQNSRRLPLLLLLVSASWDLLVSSSNSFTFLSTTSLCKYPP